MSGWLEVPYKIMAYFFLHIGKIFLVNTCTCSITTVDFFSFCFSGLQCVFRMLQYISTLAENVTRLM